MDRLQDQHYFRSNECHKLKELGWYEYLRVTLTERRAEKFMEEKEYFSGLYVIAMVDYLCRLHHLSLYEGYGEYRKYQLRYMAYPAAYSFAPQYIKEKMIKESIPEFYNFNIIEGNVFDVW